MSQCQVCKDPPLYGEVVIHAMPEVLRPLIDMINKGDVRNERGERITVSLRSAVEELGDGHVMLDFTVQYDEE